MILHEVPLCLLCFPTLKAVAVSVPTLKAVAVSVPTLKAVAVSA
jgi:hypothetical protein